MNKENREISVPVLVEHTTDIVSAFVSNNAITASDLPGLMGAVYQRLAEMANKDPETKKRPQPAVPINKSITNSHIICLEDGAKLKMLKRYLRTRHSLTPDEYRARWGLPPDYPMVAPEYAERRSKFAKKIGLGKNRKD